MNEVKAFTAWGRLYGWARKNAIKRDIPFELTRDEFDQLVIRSEERCMISGIPFDAAQYTGSARRPFAPSLDRIDSAAGYTAQNVRLVCVLVNLALNEWGIEPLLRVARNIAEREQEIRAKEDQYRSDATYVSARNYLAARYGVDGVSHIRSVSNWARQYCEYYGIRYMNTGTVIAYPESALKAVCDEMIK